MAAFIQEKLGCDKSFVEKVCDIVRRYHNPPLAFGILYDSDKLDALAQRIFLLQLETEF
jgi:hypothetical protein